jgi:hypothetical protein
VTSIAPIVSYLIPSHHPHFRQIRLLADRPSHGDSILFFSLLLHLPTRFWPFGCPSSTPLDCRSPSVRSCIATANPRSFLRSRSSFPNSSEMALVRRRNSSCASWCSRVCSSLRTDGNVESASTKEYGRKACGRKDADGVLSSTEA